MADLFQSAENMHIMYKRSNLRDKKGSKKLFLQLSQIFKVTSQLKMTSL